ncbi:MAG: hypothetical protein HOH74_15230 [Gemmatimonadetes bacterium]|nr:hypothetical protein [Gemmatimonadota bacterium]
MSHSGDALFASSARDYDLFASTRVLGLSETNQSGRRLLVLGGSTTRAAFLKRHLRQSLESAGFGDVEVVKLCTGRQKLWDTLAFVESVPKESTGVILVGVSPGLFAASNEDLRTSMSSSRLAFRSTIVSQLAVARGISPIQRRTGIYALDNARFLWGRVKIMYNNLRSGQVPRIVDSWYVGRKPVGRRQYEIRAKAIESRMSRYQQNYLSNIAVLSTIAERVRSHTQMELVFVDVPINPDFLAEYRLQQLMLEHETRIREFSLEHGIPYIVLREQISLAGDHFYDWAHLRNRHKVRRASQVIVQEIVNLYSDPIAVERSL